jgi:hypothetical protein
MGLVYRGCALSFAVEVLLRFEDVHALEGMEAKEVIVVREEEGCVGADGEGEKLVVLGVDAGGDCDVRMDKLNQLAVFVDKSEPNIEGNAIELGAKDDFAKLRVRFVADEKTMAPFGDDRLRLGRYSCGQGSN